MTPKQQFVQQVQVAMTELGQLYDRATTLNQVFADREYDAAAADPITDDDIEQYGVIVYNLGIAINLLGELKKLVDGQATQASAAYRPAVNKWRNL